MFHIPVDMIPQSVRFLIGKLERANHQAYVVGGAVRDIRLRRSVTDWDLATSASISTLRNIFRDTSHFTPGHGTIAVVIDGHAYEITTFRGKPKTLASDLAKRDLTVNAMALNPLTGEIFDPHNGLRDLKNRILRAVEDPEKRFREDPLRLVRAVRLSGQLDFQIHQATKKAISTSAPLLIAVAQERIRDELMKILLIKKPSRALNSLATLGLLKVFLPELLEGRLKRQNHYHRYTILKHIFLTVDNVAPTPLLRLTALFHDIAKPRIRFKEGGIWRFHAHEKASAVLAEEIMKRLKFSNRMIRDVAHLIKNHIIGYKPQWSDTAVRRLIKRVGVDLMADFLTFRKADILTHGKESGGVGLLAELEERIQTQLASSPPIHVSDLAIDGNAVMSVTGLPPGPAIGKILDRLNGIILEHPQWNREEKLLEILKNENLGES
jgi:tRNA nucleotidyltransferase (CCA-adding enzyme)